MKKVIMVIILLFTLTGCGTKYSKFFDEAKNSSIVEYNSEYDLYEGFIQTRNNEYYYVKMGPKMAYFYKLIPGSDGWEPYEHYYFWAKVNSGETISVVDYDSDTLITCCTLDSNCGEEDKEAFDAIRAAGSMLVSDINDYLYQIK